MYKIDFIHDPELFWQARRVMAWPLAWSGSGQLDFITDYGFTDQSAIQPNADCSLAPTAKFSLPITISLTAGCRGKDRWRQEVVVPRCPV
jgi:hypothetical protein